ncbi:hypothetical protein AGMMS49975_21620 [Clostridia bacterium]|nr:hypothetical protein AGMMS49975_21620 [Clostridia bacterium]
MRDMFAIDLITDLNREREAGNNRWFYKFVEDIYNVFLPALRDYHQSDFEIEADSRENVAAAMQQFLAFCSFAHPEVNELYRQFGSFTLKELYCFLILMREFRLKFGRLK